MITIQIVIEENPMQTDLKCKVIANSVGTDREADMGEWVGQMLMLELPKYKPLDATKIGKMKGTIRKQNL